MAIKHLSSPQLDAWIEGLVRSHRLFGPQAQGDRFSFGPLARAADLRLDYDVTLSSPKKYFQPAREVLLTFQGDAYRSVPGPEPFVLFGVHPYDLVAILQMDKVFADTNRDDRYLARREQATIVVTDVQNAAPHVFAGCMGTAVVQEGFDVLTTKLDSGWIVESRGAKGDALLEGLAGAPDADAAALKMRALVWEHNRKLLRRHELKVPPTDLPALLEKAYDHPVWEERSKHCFSCGACNLVCPTCYCFDVRDDFDWDLKSGTRTRTWDGCLLADFAKVAGGHNFRQNRASRYRHRFYRKGKYLWDQHHQIACIGCGRCAGVCVTNIANPVDVYNRIAEGQS